MLWQGIQSLGRTEANAKHQLPVAQVRREVSQLSLLPSAGVPGMLGGDAAQVCISGSLCSSPGKFPPLEASHSKLGQTTSLSLHCSSSSGNGKRPIKLLYNLGGGAEKE